jgi:hypothetical protein
MCDVEMSSTAVATATRSARDEDHGELYTRESYIPERALLYYVCYNMCVIDD